ncbi:MAG: hypothetical protein ACRDHE_17075, partial [Ktedonobacterales bacterium]
PMILASIQPWNPIPIHGFLDTVFHKTVFTIRIFGYPKTSPYSLTLIGLLIIVLIAVAANAVTEKLTSKKVGGLFMAVLVTILGSALVAAYVKLPFDFQVEGVRIIAALLGAVVIAVFYTLIRGQGAKK